MDTKPCEQCGEPIPAVSKWGVRQFCSTPCRNRGIAEKNRRHAIRECPICRRRIEGKRLTCSAACGYKFRKLRMRRQKTCPICKVEFWPVRSRSGLSKYCSLACWRVKASARLAMVKVTCAQCARTFRRAAGAVKRVERSFCNRSCRARFTVGENHPTYRGGHDPNRGPSWRKLAAEIRKRDDYLCRRCGRTQVENKQQLDVDHVIPWRLFPGDPEMANQPSNLVALCKRCHRIKTATAEAQFLKGDCLAMSQYEHAISLPPLFQHYKVRGR